MVKVQKEKRYTGADLAREMGVTRQLVNKWVRDGCPRNEDTTFNLQDMIKWRTDRANLVNRKDKSEVELEKLKLQCKQLELKISEQEKNVMPVELVDEILSERARSLSSFLVRNLVENAYALANHTAEELKPILRELAIQIMEVYTKGKGGKNG